MSGTRVVLGALLQTLAFYSQQNPNVVFFFKRLLVRNFNNSILRGTSDTDASIFLIQQHRKSCINQVISRGPTLSSHLTIIYLLMLAE